MNSNPSSPSRRRGFRFTAAVVVMAAISVLAAPPASAQTHPWGTWPAGHATASGTSNGTVLVGDSLLVNIGLQAVANHMRDVTGRSTYVNAAAGATWVTYGWPGQQNGNALIWNYSDLLKPRITVAALATNDARILTQHPSLYNQQQQYNMMHNAVAETRRSSRCVLLVNVRARGVTGMSAGAAQTVNNNMLWLVAGGYSGGGVYLADWNSHAAGNDAAWFLHNDVHMTAAGRLHYAAFISSQTQRLINNHGC